jgi:EAL domain-containing protein (putative c-di-GMP-specific phosphodiesterase class I)
MHFIRGIETSRKDQAITKIIINLAKSLGVGVLAEGVETAWQLEFLNQKKCDEVQGYYCYRPMTAGVVEKLFKGEMPENPCSVRKQASSPDSR